MAHRQQALVGYAHPFDEDVDPATPTPLTNALPIDAALGKIDYYEAVGFSDHKATNAMWYRLLECGLRDSGRRGHRRDGQLRQPARPGRPESGLRAGHRSVDARRVSGRRQAGTRRCDQRRR